MERTSPLPVPEEDEFSNRKLIRPTLTRPEGQRSSERGQTRLTARRPTPVVEQTHAENFYYQKQIQAKTQITVVLSDGEELTGYLEWYDRACFKLVRPGQSNVLVYKLNVKYLYKTSESTNGNGER